MPGGGIESPLPGQIKNSVPVVYLGMSELRGSSEVSARGESYVRPGVEDVVFGYLKLASGQVGHLQRHALAVGHRRQALRHL